MYLLPFLRRYFRKLLKINEIFLLVHAEDTQVNCY